VSSNVVGRVAGASTANQAVLYTAHYDHLGIDPDAKGDNIYNGAADNGTGCGILLELARAFAQSPVKPPHDMYFAAVTAEEQGLLGSQFLGMHPPVPAGQIALDLNYDMLLPIGDSALGEPGRRRADRLLADGADGGQGVRPGAAARSRRRWPATTTAPIISRWRGWAFRRFPSTRANCSRGTTLEWGSADGGLRSAPLSPAVGRVPRGLGLPGQRQAGAVRLCGWPASWDRVAGLKRRERQ
jgi:hypothetical protein